MLKATIIVLGFFTVLARVVSYFSGGAIFILSVVAFAGVVAWSVVLTPLIVFGVSTVAFLIFYLGFKSITA